MDFTPLSMSFCRFCDTGKRSPNAACRDSWTCCATGSPTMAPRTNGVMGRPIGRSALSATSAGVPSSKAAVTSPIRRSRMRLTTNAGASLTSTADFFRPLASSNAVASTASSVFGARTISSSGITATGLKKWKPTRRSGCSRSSAMAVTDSEEVLVARMHSGGNDRLHLLEDLLLDVELLEHRLDDEVGVGEGFLGHRPGDQRPGPVGGVGADPALLQQLVHLGVHVAHALVHPGLVDIRHHHGDLELAGEEQGELAGHQAGAHDADLGHRAGQLAVRGAGGALGPALHEVQEGVDGGAELVGLHQVRERLAFQLRGLGLRQRAVGFHHLQDLGRRRGGVGGLGLHERPARGDGAGPAGGHLRRRRDRRRWRVPGSRRRR